MPLVVDQGKAGKSGSSILSLTSFRIPSTWWYLKADGLSVGVTAIFAAINT